MSSLACAVRDHEVTFSLAQGSLRPGQLNLCRSQWNDCVRVSRKLHDLNYSVLRLYCVLQVPVVNRIVVVA